MIEKLIEMTIKEMDPEELLKQFQKVNRTGINADVMLQFMESVIPMYENTKKEVFTKMVQSTYRDLVVQMWDDPMDSDLYGRISELKKIAETLKLEINASKE